MCGWRKAGAEAFLDFLKLWDVGSTVGDRLGWR